MSTMQVTDVVKRMPMVSLRWTVEWENKTATQPSSVKAVDAAMLDEQAWMKVPFAMECIVKVELTRLNHFRVSDIITVQ